MLTGVERSFGFAVQTNDFKPLDESFITDLIQKIKALFLALIGSHSKENADGQNLKERDCFSTANVEDYKRKLAEENNEVVVVGNQYGDCGLGSDGCDMDGTDYRSVMKFNPWANEEGKNG
jgi:hypothetical protein